MANKLLSFFITLFLFTFSVNAQNKNEIKAQQYLDKAAATTDQAKKNEYYSKATDYFEKAGIGKALYVRIADAQLAEGDLVNAAKNYAKADAEGKKEGYNKLAYAYIEEGLKDTKYEAKHFKKAIDYFTKAGSAKEGYAAIGQLYYDRGPETYGKAVDNFLLAGAPEKEDLIARELDTQGKKLDAARIYERINTYDGYKKAGDIYYDLADFNNAMAVYEKGKVAEGIMKYANKLNDEGSLNDAVAMYNRAVEIYSADVSAGSAKISEIADNLFAKGNFALAASFYERAGNMTKTNEARSYEFLNNMQFDEAMSSFENANRPDMVKAIKDNRKYLDLLVEPASQFDVFKANEPSVSVTEENGVKKVNQSEYESLLQYYKENQSVIFSKVSAVSTNVSKISHPDLKKMMMVKFSNYNAVKRILDPQTFAVKVQKNQLTADDLRM